MPLTQQTVAPTFAPIGATSNYGAGNNQQSNNGTNTNAQLYGGGNGSPYAGVTSAQLVGMSSPASYGPGGQIALTNAQNGIGQEQALAGQMGQQVGYYQGMQAPTMQGAQLGYAPQAGAASNQFQANGQAAQINGAVNAGQVQINQGQSNQDRNLQMQNIGALQQQAAGQGPSVAAQQAQASSQSAIAGQMAAAASQRGSSNASLGLRAAQNQAAANQQATAQTAVQGRMQEQLNAQQQLGSVIGNQQGQDIGLASTQAGLTQQTNLANAGAANQVNSQNAQLAQQNYQFNTGQNAQTSAQNAQMQQQANLANQSMQGQYGLQQGQFDQQTGEANLQSNLNQQQLNNQMVGNLYSQQAGLYGNSVNQNLAEAGQMAGQGQAAAQLSNEENEFGINQAGQYISSVMSMAGGAMSDENVKTGIEDINAQTSANEQSLAGQLNQEDQSNMKVSETKGDKSSGGSSGGGGGGSSMSSMMSSFGGGGAGGGADAGAGASGGDAAASAMSDERDKKDIHDEDEYQAQSFLDSLKAHSFRYKDPAMGKGRFTGVMAQELEKTEIGKQAVVETEKGKAVDYARLASIMLAGQVMQNQQIKQLRLEVKSLKGGK